MLNSKSSLIDLSQAFESLKSSLAYFLLVILLMPLNWLIETFKWHRLVLSETHLSLSQALSSIIFGVTLSLLTPNRLGELGGRLLFIKKSDQLKVLYINTICSFSQLMTTFIMGLIAYMMLPIGQVLSNSTLYYLGPMLIVGMLIIYFSSAYLKRVLSSINHRFKLDRDALTIPFKMSDRLITILLSLLRYVIFLTQFAVLLIIFENSISYFEAMLAAAIIFLIATAIPTAWISDLPVRTSVAFFILETMGYNGSAALIASVLLWLLNLLVPAIIGLKYFKNINYLKPVV